MKKNNTIAVLATLAVLVSSAASAVEVDGIVAQVGDVTILKSDVVTAMRRMGGVSASAERKSGISG